MVKYSVMKLIIAILRDEDSDPISKILVEQEFRVTQVASTGGFLRRGSSTLMVGVDDDKVDNAIEIIRTNISGTDEPGLRRATLFVLKVDRFVQI
jgi:uncharacterized protein YaaQ